MFLRRPLLAAPALAAEPGDEPTLVELVEAGKAEITAGQFEPAISHLQEAVDQAPDDGAIAALLEEAKQKGAEAYIAEGKKAIAARQYSQAVVDFENALQILPGHPAALKAKEAAEKWPRAEAYVAAAKEQLAKNNWDHAITYFQKAYDLTGDPGIAKWLAEAKAARAKK